MQRTLILLALLIVAGPAVAQDPNACDPGEVPDVIVGHIPDIIAWGSEGNISAFSFGTTSCNIGTCWLNWFSNTNQHPVIGQNIFRLKDDRFEQLGQSWLKHGFYALSDELCTTGCLPTDGTHLGVNCSDPYTAWLNGNQSGLGPKYEVNPWRGDFPYPYTDPVPTGNKIFKRVQVSDRHLDPALNAGARYFVEGQYVTADDGAGGNGDNNASFREVTVSENNGDYTLNLIGATEREKPAILAWSESDPSVLLEVVPAAGDGLFYFASRAHEVAAGYWHYEYAIQNLNSDRGGGSFEIVLPGGAQPVGIGFNDVSYHSGEPFDNTDWTATVIDDGTGTALLQWTTDSHGVNPNANALRWGTLYNFRFDLDRPPGPNADAVLNLFKPGAQASISAQMVSPDPCRIDGVCTQGEDCFNCPADCLGAASMGFCGDGICETALNEDCVGCPDDCAGVQSGSPSNRYCCGAGGGSNPIDCQDPRCEVGGLTCDDSVLEDCCGDGQCDLGEDPCLCPADCGPCVETCLDTGDCDDGIFCNGAEECTGGTCQATASACGGQLCDEANDTCIECLQSDYCDDGLFCNGFESCVGTSCMAGADPCPGQLCNEASEQCGNCFDDQDCDDGTFCNGAEFCLNNGCHAGSDPCSGTDYCDESIDSCVACTAQCDDGIFCNGAESCIADECFAAEDPCPGRVCDEAGERCLGNVTLQAQPGQPLFGLASADAARFDAGRVAFETPLSNVDGLGPIYNAASCAACHATPASGGTGSIDETRFGFDDGATFDPLSQLGGSLLQAQTTDPSCQESVPAAANVVAQRLASPTFGAGLIEQLADADILNNALNPPTGVSGRAHSVTPLEAPATTRVGRFGWKAQEATVLSIGARSARDRLGLTNRLLVEESAPNGSVALLSGCDAVSDPEDGPDAQNFDRIDRLSDFQRWLAPPPQTPRQGLQGEVVFVTVGCDRCHTRVWTTPDDSSVPLELRDVTIQPYTDFLLHDMGAAADGIARGDAAPDEMRTSPLWGLRWRSRLWHDGRVSDADFTDRVLAAIELHDSPGSEASFAVQNLAVLPQISRDQLVVFLDSLGRLEFDHDGDDDVDDDDFTDFLACFSGPGSFYIPADACSIGDVDRDGDVDDDDYALFTLAFDGGFGGSIPDGATVAGSPLVASRGSSGAVQLSWSPSCADETDYAVYVGEIGDFQQSSPELCSTGGLTSISIDPLIADAFFLVVPHNTLREGAYGLDDAGQPRAPSPNACFAQSPELSCPAP